MSLLLEIYKYRGLVWALTARHLASRYRRSTLGFLWSLLNPLFFMLIYTLVFKYYIRFQEVENYSVYLFCGMLPWIWLNSGLIEGSSAIVSSGHLITKSMFPPQILPLVTVLTNLIHYLLSLILLFLFMIVFKINFSWTLLLLPILIAVQFVIMYGLALMLSTLNVHYRDVQHLLGSIFSLLFFLCPIIYPAKVVPDRFRFTMDLNPFAQLIESYHNIIINGELPTTNAILVLSLTAILSILVGQKIFNFYRESLAEAL